MRSVVVGVCLVLAGCVTQIQPVPRNWDHASDPRCTASYGYVAGDAAIAITAAGGGLGVALAVSDGTQNRDAAATIALSGLAVGIVFALAGSAGYDRVQDCERATREWRVAQATARREMRKAPKPATPTTPRGFFCASSAAGGGLCTRERSACEQARDAAVAVVPDLGACSLVETAWCFAIAGGRGDRCAPSEAACTEQLGRAGTDAVGECEERR